MRWTLYLSLVVALILITLEGINFGRYFGEVLNETIKKSYSGKYALEFDQINYKVWKNVFVAHNFTFRELSADDSLKTGPVYVHMDEVIFDVDNIVNILLKKEFSVDGIMIQNPIIRIIQEEAQDDGGEGAMGGREVFNSFYNLVMETVFALEIENLDVEHARLSITFNAAESESNISFDDISFRIADLKIDAHTLSEDLINLAEEVEVSFYNQRFYTFDSAFQVEVDTFLLTTDKPRIEVIGLDFVDTTSQYLGATEAEFSVSHMILEGVDLNRLYRDNFLQVDSLLIDANNINLSDVLIARKENDDPDKPKKFARYLNQSFAGLAISTLLFQQQGLSVLAKNRGKIIDFELDSLDLTIQGLRLDSTSRSKRFDIDYEDVVLRASRYTRNLPDSVHQLMIKNIQISATQKRLIVDSLQVLPVNPQNRNHSLIDLQIPEIILDNANTVEFLNGELLEVEAMKIIKPELVINRSPASAQPDKATSLRDILEDIPFGRIDQLEIEYGNMAVDPLGNGSALAIRDFQLKINDLIKEDSSTIFYYAPYGLNEVNFFSGSVELKNEGNLWQLYDLTSQLGLKTNIGCEQGRIIERVKIDSNMVFDLASEFENLRLRGVDHNVVSEGNIELDSIFLGALQVNSIGVNDPLYSKYDLNPDKKNWKLKSFICKHIDIPKISIEAELDKLTAMGIKNSSIRLEQLLYRSPGVYGTVDKWKLKDADLAIHHFQFSSGKQSHNFLINDAQYSFDQKLLNISWLSYLPAGDNKMKQTTEIRAETLTVEGLDLLGKLNFEPADIRKISLDNWSADITTVQPTRPDRKSVNLAPLLQKLGPSGSIGIISATNGELNHHQLNADDTAQVIEVARPEFNLRQLQWDDRPYISWKDFDNLEADVKSEEVHFKNSQGLTLKIRKPEIKSNGEFFRTNSGSLRKIQDKRNTLNIEYDSLHWRGADFMSWWVDKDLIFDQLIVFNPDINWNGKKGSNKNLPKITIPHSVFNTIDFEYVNLKNLSLNHGENNIINRFRELDIVLEDYYLKASDYTVPELIDKGRAKIEIFNFRDTTKNGMEHFGFEKVLLNFSSGDLSANNLFFEPLMDRNTYAIAKGLQTDHITATIPYIKVDNIDWIQCFDKKFIAGTVFLERAEIQVYRDKNFPPDTNRIKALPREMLLNLPWLISVDTVNFEGVDITYKEKSDQSQQTGLIAFDEVEGTIINLTNDDHTIISRPFMQLNTTGWLYDESAVELSVKFDLLSKRNKFTMMASLAPFNLQNLNQAMEPLARVRVKSGINNKMEILVAANEYYATGTMEFLYEKLRINILNKKTFEAKGLGPSLGTFFANTFIINNRNPHFLFAREGYIFYERDRKKSLFNYWAKIILSGAVSSIGAENNKKEIKKATDQRIKEFDPLN